MVGGALICALLGILLVLGIIIIITMSRRASTPTPTTASEATPVTATPAASSSSTSLGVPLLPPLATPAAPATVDTPRVAMSASVEQRRALQELRRLAAQDVSRCECCGYTGPLGTSGWTLRHLRVIGRCPECMTPLGPWRYL